MNTNKRTDGELNRIIAEWCGWKVTKEEKTGALDNRRLHDPSGVRTFTMGFFGFEDAEAEMWKRAPNCCRDLNAVHEACNKLKDWPDTSPESEQRMFIRALTKVVFSVITCTQNDFLIINATARQRAEALVKVIEEGKK